MTPLSSADPAAVLACYDLLDLSVTGGIEDFTEGIYAGDPKRPYPEAQRLKNEYLLDEIGCRRGSRILDIGCGYGTLLEAAHRRGRPRWESPSPSRNWHAAGPKGSTCG